MEQKICKVDECSTPQRTKGYCNKHYQRLLTYGNPLHLEREQHGRKNTVEYKSWLGMIARCHNENTTGFEYWGGRGITVCERWLHSFNNFLEDMGEKPFPKAQIDRKENDKGYCKSNCRWVTQLVNNRNRSCVKLSMEKAKEIRYKHFNLGITQTALGAEYNVSVSVVNYVIMNKTWREDSA